MVGAPTEGPGGTVYTLYGPQQSPPGDPASFYYNDNGTYSIYQTSLGQNVDAVNGDVIVLDGPDLSYTDKAYWSDFISFNNPDTDVTLTSYEGSDPSDFWADYNLSDTVVYILETGGTYTIYTAVNDSGGYFTYQITPQVHNAVPEPTTMIAGALLLLPFGMNTLRLLRKSRIVLSPFHPPMSQM